ncbi:beta-phosphoglucomutase family hydrolase [Rugosimonospora acidiphila]|uniref:Beta-phosphoglucomutase family hydrolase n=1 Tax=Rugosimonospora acidiphila TaxID=556531 RepID=A0ABP9RXC2_9ACTN
MNGLPDRIRAALFDLDGVLTPTAAVHAAAWKEMFDAFLRGREGPGFRPFSQDEYNQYVDGRARADGTRSFLASRGVMVPEGSPEDPADADTVEGLSERKDEIFRRMVEKGGIQPYPGSERYLRAVRAAGLRTAVVSASRHCAQIVRAAGLEDLLDARIDGIVAARDRLPGKPAPDTYRAAAGLLNVIPTQAAVFEDALAGVSAGRAGRFGYVVGVDRIGDQGPHSHSADLKAHGADAVVRDLADLLDES